MVMLVRHRPGLPIGFSTISHFSVVQYQVFLLYQADHSRVKETLVPLCE